MGVLMGLVFVFPSAALAHHRIPLTVQSNDKTIFFELPIDNEGGGVSLIASDLGDDGVDEFIVGNGLGNEPRVRVLRLDGSEIGSFLAYAPDMGLGINVIACDLAGDGKKEIVVSPQRGGGPQIRVFDGFGKAIDDGGFFAYAESFRGGVNLACGDLDGKKGDELVTLPAADGGPHVRVWSFASAQATRMHEFFAFDATDRSGLVGVVKNNQLTVVQQHADDAIEKTFDHTFNVVEEQHLQQKNILSAFLLNNERVVTTQAGDIFSIDTKTKTHLRDGGVVAAAHDEQQDGIDELVYTKSKPLFNSDDATRILVDISEQRLYAYTEGVLDNTFLISSGLWNSTPLGIHHILAKIYEVDYKWSYGPNDPRNYDLGIVPYNLRYEPHKYLHYAYWHNNFGHKMSHGCVNVSLENMKWLYNWGREGIEVLIQT